jgi:hypothetical protein
MLQLGNPLPMQLSDLVSGAKLWLLVAKIFRPPPAKAPDQWADVSRILSKRCVEACPWKSNRTPYIIPIARAWSIPKYGVISALAPQMRSTNGVLYQ